MGNENAYDIVVTFIINHQDPAYRLAYSFVRHREDALDVLQDATYKALRSYRSLTDLPYAKSWYYRIVINTALDHLRRKKRVLYLEEDRLENASSVVYEVEADEELDLKQALEKLPPESKALLLLRFAEDMKLEEIASTLNENLNTVKGRLYTTLKKLRLELGEIEKETAEG